jgi:hypothetical protein
MSGEFDTSVSANHHFRSWRDKSPVAGAAAQIAQGWLLRLGVVFRQAKGRKVPGSTTGPIASSIRSS